MEKSLEDARVVAQKYVSGGDTVVNEPCGWIHEDGVYFGLKPEEYHADPALGSTSLREIAVSPFDWWWMSDYNPEKEEKESKAMDLGSALHARVLEGLEGLEERFVSYDFDLRSKAAKEAYQGIKDSGKTPIKKADYDKILSARKWLLSNKNVAQVYEHGVAEVSVFWTHKSGVRLKARLDWISPKGVFDLKTFAPRESRGIDVEIRRILSGDRLLPMQAAHYMSALPIMDRFFKEEKFYADDGYGYEKIGIAAYAANHWKEMCFSWIFFKTKFSPESKIMELPIGSAIYEYGQNRIENAIGTYIDCVANYGLDNPWVPQNPVEMVFEEELFQYAAIFDK